MSIVLVGSTSGSVTLQEPAVAGTTVIDLPATSGTMVVTGGAQTVQFAAGSASTPSITFTGDTNTGIFSPGADTIAFTEGGAESMRIDSSGNVGIGTSSPVSKLQVADTTATRLTISKAANSITNNEELGSILWRINGGTGTVMGNIYYTGNSNSTSDGTGALVFGARSNNNATTLVESMRITSGGTLIVNDTATSAFFDGRVSSFSATLPGLSGKTSGGAAMPAITSWNTATSGDNLFLQFATETTATARGSIDYNRGAGLVRYNTTSDATLKNIIGDSDGKKSIDILKSTRIREYAWKDDAEQKPQIGVIAQELYETYKGAVSVGGEIEKTDEQGNVTTQYNPWTVDKTAFTFHLIAGWQEHQKLIQEQQAIITDLKARIETLENK